MKAKRRRESQETVGKSSKYSNALKKIRLTLATSLRRSRKALGPPYLIFRVYDVVDYYTISQLEF